MLQTKIGWNGVKCSRTMLDENDAINCTFTSTDAKISNDIWGKNIDAIRGREIIQSQKAMPKLDTAHVPTALK